MNKKKKIIKNIIMILSLIVIGYSIFIIINNYKDNIIKKNLKDVNWINKNVNIILSDTLGNNIYEVKKDKNITIDNTLYQNIIDEKIDKLLNDTYDFKSPLIILNPYGTNNLGLNIYFNTDEEMQISYTIKVDDNNIDDFSRILNNDNDNNYTKEHSYQIIGLIPGKINTIELVAINSQNEKIYNSITIDMSDIKCSTDTILESIDTENSNELTEGLFVLFGLDKAFNANNYIYDNNGVLRADLVLNNYRSDRIIFYKNKMYYSYDTNKIGVINRLGKIEKTYTLDGYTMHHDYILDSNNEKLLVLVNSNEQKDKTIEDLIISIDLNTDEINEIIDMKELLPDIYETATMPESGKILMVAQDLIGYI